MDARKSYCFTDTIGSRVIQTHNSSSTTRIIKNLELAFTEHKFDKKDPILILDFPARFTEEFEMLGMIEGQTFMTVPKVLLKTEAVSYTHLTLPTILLV